MAKRNYTLEELKSKNLFQLRDIARKLGVENATYLSEEKLMESIIAYEAGEKQPTAEENGISEQTDQAMISRGFIYSEEDFKNMTIHTVRKIARDMGIKISDDQEKSRDYRGILQNYQRKRRCGA